MEVATLRTPLVEHRLLCLLRRLREQSHDVAVLAADSSTAALLSGETIPAQRT